ncbi:4-hydroxyphenylacetate 3-monooxygenase, oxygenase component [Sporolactobacillus kofuensis]|uniref:4-hydroxyphenylacetate 3-monooxygenase, oxygenase component n=1 Tax=Sporolactobacillus kofuensis TaxID=269672 RepID=A0ABW1WIJ9_9BACL|nr:4-hydroxyphenylacetate 3-monooxygenase, oxygenase component [Sporolactobacillus kofuensis]MCO7176222.1 4-hydroxyphenylacetate 3-monooxygenase, oxygenase component [Sporolactobacillus kofuensis]
MSCIDGKTYVERINQLNNDVWINGAKITGHLSEHPAFNGVMKSQAKLYDMQHDPDYQEILTYQSLNRSYRIGMSYLEPKTKEDLVKRRKAFQVWARQSVGMMGRSPDYMNTVVMTFAACAELFGDKQCTENMRNFYTYCTQHDISLTHTFIQPQVNRSALYFENESDAIAARVIEENKDGLVIHGARLLATQGGMTDELLVFPTGAFHFDSAYAYAFSIPSNTTGLKFSCRESFHVDESGYDHPLSSRFEEVDTVVFFDHVTVPWDRVFLHNNTDVASRLYTDSGFMPHQIHQVTSRNVIKTEFILGVLQSMIDAINIGEYQHIQEKISEVIVTLETLKALLIASEVHASLDQWGTMTPDRKPLFAAMNLFPRIYPRFIEIMQLIGASGLVSIPSDKDFQSHIGKELKHYLQSADRDGYEKVKLFRLAWDLSMSAFAGRQTLYERFFFGDPVRLASGLYRDYDRTEYVNWVKEFLKRKE